MSIVQLHPNVLLGVSYLLIYVDSSTCTHDWIRSDLVGPRKLTRRAETVPSRPAPLVRCGYEEGTGTAVQEGRKEGAEKEATRQEQGSLVILRRLRREFYGRMGQRQR